jgi:O-acetyl-ADP-ribose deacetylase (regulator of RNase III)
MKGDITELNVDAIVNAANSRLVMGGGVAGAIKRKGGVEIEREAVKKGPIPIGKAIETGAGKLKAKYVIHAPTMEYPGPTSTENVSRATDAAMRKAKELKIKSIAFPGFGTGVGRLSFEEAAKSMVSTILKGIKGSKLEVVILTDINDGMVKAFEEEVKRLVKH